MTTTVVQGDPSWINLVKQKTASGQGRRTLRVKQKTASGQGRRTLHLPASDKASMMPGLSAPNPVHQVLVSLYTWRTHSGCALCRMMHSKMMMFPHHDGPHIGE
eukprot:CAMPEP_0206585146 /NCGR_PEP_ID=MMETSP0325_2-20121206/36231_1 /ASSEMBLY_ACC=CAM_ASM_000347 /TAXON_ID=2866 /ORGANISM="Crypthecodinium cohnii, Strain Seligo" /LENGTH=103 /DNA_ID=CAMNT_0054092613 /DNA_START=290 /DNA_END=601 /DNA_ORIENTATION=+